MLIGRNRRRTGDVNQVTEASGGRNSCGTPAFSGSHSASTSGSASSPSGWNEQAAVATPANEPDFVRRLNQLDMHGEEAGSSQGTVSGKKKKRGTRAAACDKSGRGLRQFSMKVCEKVESKGTTTYNEVADEVVAEFAEPNKDPASPDQIERAAISSRIDKKTAYLQELEDQIVGLQNLIQRNEQLHGTENGPLGGVALPFILVQTRPHATVEVEIAEDMQLVHFDFNSTPFELHDDTYVLKAMRFCEREPKDCAHQPSSNGGEHSSTVVTFSPLLQQATRPSPSSAINLSTPTTIPGILKTRCMHEHRNQ